MANTVIRLIYGALGAVFLLAGIAGLLFLSLPEGDPQSEFATSLAQGLTHLSMELGAAILALGSLMLWRAVTDTKSAPLDNLFLGFFLIFAGIHWVEFIYGNRTIVSPLINSIPFSLFVGVLLLRKQTGDRE